MNISEDKFKKLKVGKVITSGKQKYTVIESNCGKIGDPVKHRVSNGLFEYDMCMDKGSIMIYDESNASPYTLKYAEISDTPIKERFITIEHIDMVAFVESLNMGFAEYRDPKHKTMEYVYSAPVKDHPTATIYLFTSISKYDGYSRSKGSDAIRLIIKNKDGKWLTQKTRILRVPGWRDRITRYIHELSASIKVCEYEGGLMIPHDFNGKKFYGCENYPICKNTIKR